MFAIATKAIMNQNQKREINADELKELISDAFERSAITPKGKWQYFKSLPRPLLKYATIPLIPYGLLTDVGPQKFNSLLLFIALLYGIRGMEKSFDAWNKRNDQPSYYQPISYNEQKYRREPDFDDINQENQEQPDKQRSYD